MAVGRLEYSIHQYGSEEEEEMVIIVVAAFTSALLAGHYDQGYWSIAWGVLAAMLCSPTIKVYR